MDSVTARSNQGAALEEDRADSQDRDVEGRETTRRDADDFACPVCGAHQALSKACRRCRADLSLVTAVRSELAANRERCAALIRQRRLLRATRLAKECLELSRDESNLRLLATCYLLQGDFAAALRLEHQPSIDQST